MTTPLLSVEDLHITFSSYLGSVAAVRGVSFSIHPGETVAIVGESGSGKSVTAQTIMGLLPSTALKEASGEVFFNGEKLPVFQDKAMQPFRGKDVGMVFQNPMSSLNPTMRIGHQITEAITKCSAPSRAGCYDQVLDLLKRVGITHPAKRYHQYPYELSGGMLQRVMIAIALASTPKLLIADEPTTALDVTIQAQILELMQSIVAETQTAILLITHDLGIVAGIADRILVMYAGEIVEAGDVETLFYKPQHPYTKALLAALPDITTKAPLATIPGSPPDLHRPILGCAFAPRCAHRMHVCTSHHPPSFTKQENQHAKCWLHHSHGAPHNTL